MSAQDSIPSDLLFRFHWLDKTVTEGPGRDAADALNRLGYGRGSIRALDYWESKEIEDDANE